MYIRKINSVTRVPKIEGELDLTLDYTGVQKIEDIDSSAIPTKNLLRMSDGVALGCAAAIPLLQENKFDAIITGVGLGFVENTGDFILNVKKDFKTAPAGAFVDSVHNTIGGQLAILQNSHCYNVTHSHGPDAFYSALVDAKMHLLEGRQDVLVGGIDECPVVIQDIKGVEALDISEGSTFIDIGASSKNSLGKITHLVQLICSLENQNEVISKWINENGLKDSRLIYGEATILPSLAMPDAVSFNYSDSCGIYFGNLGFGIDAAVQRGGSTLVMSRSAANKISLVHIEC